MAVSGKLLPKKICSSVVRSLYTDLMDKYSQEHIRRSILTSIEMDGSNINIDKTINLGFHQLKYSVISTSPVIILLVLDVVHRPIQF